MGKPHQRCRRLFLGRRETAGSRAASGNGSSHSESPKENAPIVITHGTDSMVDTALYLQRVLEARAIPIVLTGAMTPLGFEGSDGLQNLTESG